MGSMRTIIIITLALLGIARATAWAQDPPAIAAAQLPQLPRTAEEFAARLDGVESQLKALRGDLASLPPSPENTEALERQQRIETRIQAWSDYQDGVKQADLIAKEIARLTGTSDIRQSAEEVSRLEAEAAAALQPPSSSEVTEEGIQAVEARLNEVRARVGELTLLQNQRQARLTSGLEARLKELDAQRAQLEQMGEGVGQEAQPKPEEPQSPQPEAGSVERKPLPKDESPGATTTVVSPPPREGQLTVSSVRLAAVECAVQALSLERQLLELQSSRDKPLLDALQRLREALGKRRDALVRDRSENTVEALQSQRGTEAEPVEAALVELKLFHERVLQTWWRNPPGLSELRERLDRLDQPGGRTREDWEVEKSLAGFYTGDELALLHDRIQEDIRSGQRRLDAAGRLRADCLASLRELRSVQARSLGRFDELHKALAETLPSLQQVRRTEIETEVATLKSDLTLAIEDGIRGYDQIAADAASRVEKLGGDLAALRAMEQQLYWKRLAFRDSGLMGTDWRQVWGTAGDLRAELMGDPAPALLNGRQQRDVELFGRSGGSARTDLRALLARGGDEVRALGTAAFVWVVGVALLALVAGFLVLRATRRNSVPLADAIRQRYEQMEREEGRVPVRRGLRARIDLLLLNMLGDLAVPAFLGAA